jgi:thiol-disulfide isomerase/thioredoxin/sugar lactone lactonase YvrE
MLVSFGLLLAGCGRSDVAARPVQKARVAGLPSEMAVVLAAAGAVGDEDRAEGERAAASGAERSEPQRAEPAAAPAKGGKAKKGPPKPGNPFRNRIDIEGELFPAGMEWLNSKPLTKTDLKGKFVLLDFWTYCCINCIHILPELKKLEKQFPNELVVIGVHSAKFDTEKQTDNIREAILRYEIVHPVVNDAEHKIWDEIGVSSWPSLLMLDPEGKAVLMRSGEFKAEDISAVLRVAIPYYRDAGLLDETPMKFELEAAKEDTTPLRFPGKILADEKSSRLFITDSNHNRIVIATLEGKLLETIGSGKIGRDDGDFATASFDHPQGVALDGDTLYVADTENHLLRKVNLKTKTVKTIAGTGSQAAHAWPGIDEAELTGRLPERWVGPPATTAINSPWALWIHKGDLYIAMAGPHQIWKMPLSESEIGPYAGNGREDIVDGPLLPRQPYQQGYSSFAQPSGLSSDGTWLYVADSEGSSVRAVPFDPKKNVRTVVGSDGLLSGRLFAFGDVDGPRSKAKLQHCLEVVYVEGKIYVADTYNHKIKVVDAKSGATKTLAGTGEPGASDEPAQFHEPAGLAHAYGKLYVADTNNHLIRTIDLASGKVATFTIAGLTSPNAPAGSGTGGESVATTPTAAPAAPVPAAPKKPAFKNAAQEKVKAASVKATDDTIRLRVSLVVPKGWKINELAPMSYWLDSTKEAGPADRTAFGRTKLSKPLAEFEVPVKVSGEGDDELNVSLNYAYCQTGDEGVCKVGSVVFTVPVTIAADGSAQPVKLVHEIVE